MKTPRGFHRGASKRSESGRQGVSTLTIVGFGMPALPP
jgi:hypothetical protein